MIRYFRQYDKHSCGPIALMNAHRWAGYSVTRTDLQRYSDELFCFKHGTPYICFAEIVKKHLRAKVDKSPTLSSISKQLSKGRIAILHVGDEGHFGHYFLVTRQHEDGWFRVVNLYNHPGVPVEMSISRKVLRESLRKRNKQFMDAPVHKRLLTLRYHPYPTAWYVSGMKE